MYYQKIMRVLPIMYYLDIYFLDLGEWKDIFIHF